MTPQPTPGVITLGPPIKVIAGLTSDATNVIGVFTPSVVGGLSVMNAYFITAGVVVSSGVYRVAGSGVAFSAENGLNGITCLLIKGATQPLDEWQIAANGLEESGTF